MKENIKVIEGDATEPIKKPAIIAHVCNNSNGWGSGFVVPLGEKYPEARINYHKWFNSWYENVGQPTLPLGEVQLNGPYDEVYVANMIGQHLTYYVQGIPPIRYEAIEQGLTKVNQMAKERNCSIHMPKIGSGLAGGDWNRILSIIEETLTVETYIYEFI